VSSSKRPASKPAAKGGRGSAGRKAAAAPPARRPSAGPPASARITIKPGSATSRPRTVELPPRPRPAGTRRLSEVVLEEDEVLIESFDATLEGATVRVTAVLERTCVYLGGEGERLLASKNDVWVEADKLPIRRRGIG
jgi:hypothetical protein